MQKILISDGISEAGLQVLKQDPQLHVEVHQKMPPEALIASVADADALIVRSASKVTQQVLSNAQKLRVIGRAGTGVDNIDLDEATRRGILVMNAPEANTISVADHTVAMILALCRHLPFAHTDLKQGKWEKKKYEGIELEDKVVGILGLGRIGREVVKRLHGFNTRIVAYDPYVSEKIAKELEVQLMSVDEILKLSDFLSLHMPTVPETENFLNRERFEQMKPGMFVVNCARGELIDEDALYQALESGTVAGAALDVFTEEPPKSEKLLKLVQHPRVILTPHLAASTLEAQEKVGYQIAVQIRDFLKEGVVKSSVNFYSMSREEYARNEPYLILGDRLGAVAAQLSDGGYERVKIEFHGSVAALSKEAIISSVLKGILSHALSGRVNIVNAVSLAKERKIDVVSTVAEQDPTFSSLLVVALETDRSRQIMSGTVFEKNIIRLLSMNNVYLDFRPSGNLLYFRNQDKPGVVGKIGTLLGTRGINIASMKLGQVPDSQEACGVVAIDGELPDAVVHAMKQVPEILEARALRL